jgi:hypothetical protein
VRALILLLAGLAAAQAHPEPVVEEYYRRAASVDADDVGADVIADLLARAGQRREAEPDSADAWLASGILRATYARSLGIKGLRELELARTELRRSTALDGDWMDGYAEAFLARLYATVPGWPISFGSDRQATRLLAEVVGRKPRSLAGNLYEGMRLLDEGERAQAAIRLKIARKGGLDCECPHWSATLRAQASEALERTN